MIMTAAWIVFAMFVYMLLKEIAKNIGRPKQEPIPTKTFTQYISGLIAADPDPDASAITFEKIGDMWYVSIGGTVGGNRPYDIWVTDGFETVEQCIKQFVLVRTEKEL